MLREVILCAAGLDYDLIAKKSTYDTGKIQKSNFRKAVAKSKAMLSTPKDNFFLGFDEYYRACFEKDGLFKQENTKLNTKFLSFADYLEAVKSELEGLGIDFDEFAKRYEVKRVRLGVENKNEAIPTFSFSAKSELNAVKMEVGKYDFSYIYTYNTSVTLEEFISGGLYQNDILNSGAAALLNSWKTIDAMQYKGKKVYEGCINPDTFVKKLFSL